MSSNRPTVEDPFSNTEQSSHAIVSSLLAPTTNALSLTSPSSFDRSLLPTTESFGIPTLKPLPNIDEYVGLVSASNTSETTSTPLTRESNTTPLTSDDSENSSGISSYSATCTTINNKRKRLSDSDAPATNTHSDLIVELIQQLVKEKEKTTQLRNLLEESNNRANYYEHAYNASQHHTHNTMGKAYASLRRMAEILGPEHPSSHQSNASQRLFYPAPSNTSQQHFASSSSSHSASSTHSIAHTPSASSAATTKTLKQLSRRQ